MSSIALLSSRGVRVSLVVASLFTALLCGGCATSNVAASPANAAPKPAAAHTPADTVPGVSRTGGCNQNTHPKVVPVSLSKAGNPVGGGKPQQLLAAIKQLNPNDQGAAVYQTAPLLASAAGPSLDGVLCPDGKLYQYGDSKPWATNVRLLDMNNYGKGVQADTGLQMYSHPASQVLTKPCPVVLGSLGTNPALKRQLLETGQYYMICLDNGDMNAH